MPNTAKPRQNGLSLIELLVGMSTGLIVASGSSILAVNQISEHRRLMLETQIQQDLRAVSHLIQQDLRRAGFRGQAERGVWAPGSGQGLGEQALEQGAQSNAYDEVHIQDDSTSTTIYYSYAKPLPDGSYNPLPTVLSNERLGIKWNKANKTLYLLLGGDTPNWQPITDPKLLLITHFSAELRPQTLALDDFCPQACPPSAGSCPSLQVREIRYTLTAQAYHDAAVQRQVSAVERIRSDASQGSCAS